MRTKFHRAKTDTCSNVNVMLVCVYKLIYKDPDCVNLAPSNKDGILTYTTEKIKIIGSCELLVVHPNTKCFKEVKFQVVSHEGRVIVSCTTSIDLTLIQPHSELKDRVLDCSRLIYSCADDPGKHTYKKAKPNASKTEVTQWKNQDVYKENNACQAEKVICSQGTQQKDIWLDKQQC